jgi:sulfite reductase (ferredoxin)
MKSFRTEIEDPIVAKDIIDLEKKIHAFNNDNIDGEKFRSLRLARGVYGQRQSGVQMIRIKLPMGRFKAKQLRRMAEVSDTYSNGNLHITTRQDIQLHYVSLEDTPELWATLEKDQITLREACGNTVRNVTASIWAGVDTKEAFDVTPYAESFFEYFLRNPLCQDLGRKIKVAFSSSSNDQTMTFVHDLGFIPVLQNQKRGFKVVLGGGIGAQPEAAHEVLSFLEEDQLIPFSEAVIRVFEKYGERNRRNKARMKFLVKELGIELFMEKVEEARVKFDTSHKTVASKRILQFSDKEHSNYTSPTDKEYSTWLKTNTFPQKQKGFKAVGIPIPTGNISSEKARELATIIENFTGDDNRFTIGQSILLRDVKEECIPGLYQALKAIGLNRIGFHKVNDIVACPGTDTCNLGIASSMGLSKVLQEVIENEFKALIHQHDINIKISGCMNACGQHTIANIGFQGMTIKKEKLIAPATQVLLGGGELENGQGRFADKVLKIPAKRTPKVLRWILLDFENSRLSEEDFLSYYDRKTTDYFYQNLKSFSSTDDLVAEDYIDWGNSEKYIKAIGIGECAGVTIDLVQTLLFDAGESLGWAKHAYEEKKLKDAQYHCYNSVVRASKALLTSKQAKTNSHASITQGFDLHFPEYETHFDVSFESVLKKNTATDCSEINILQFIEWTTTHLDWIKKTASNNE